MLDSFADFYRRNRENFWCEKSLRSEIDRAEDQIKARERTALLDDFMEMTKKSQAIVDQKIEYLKNENTVRKAEINCIAEAVVSVLPVKSQFRNVLLSSYMEIDYPYNQPQSESQLELEQILTPVKKQNTGLEGEQAIIQQPKFSPMIPVAIPKVYEIKEGFNEEESDIETFQNLGMFYPVYHSDSVFSEEEPSAICQNHGVLPAKPDSRVLAYVESKGTSENQYNFKKHLKDNFLFVNNDRFRVMSAEERDFMFKFAQDPQWDRLASGLQVVQSKTMRKLDYWRGLNFNSIRDEYFLSPSELNNILITSFDLNFWQMQIKEFTSVDFPKEIQSIRCPQECAYQIRESIEQNGRNNNIMERTGKDKLLPSNTRLRTTCSFYNPPLFA